MKIGDEKGKWQIREKLMKISKYTNKSEFITKVSVKLCKKIQYQAALEVDFAFILALLKFNELEYFTAITAKFDRACPFLIGLIIFAWIKRRLAILGTGLHSFNPCHLYIDKPIPLLSLKQV